MKKLINYNNINWMELSYSVEERMFKLVGKLVTGKNDTHVCMLSFFLYFCDHKC